MGAKTQLKLDIQKFGCPQWWVLNFLSLNPLTHNKLFFTEGIGTLFNFPWVYDSVKLIFIRPCIDHDSIDSSTRSDVKSFRNTATMTFLYHSPFLLTSSFFVSAHTTTFHCLWLWHAHMASSTHTRASYAPSSVQCHLRRRAANGQQHEWSINTVCFLSTKPPPLIYTASNTQNINVPPAIQCVNEANGYIYLHNISWPVRRNGDTVRNGWKIEMHMWE